MEMEIRRLTADDTKEIPETSAIYIDCYYHDYGPFFPREELEKLNVEEEARGCKQWVEVGEHNRLYAGFVDGRMVGYISVSPYTDQPLPYEMELSGFFVRPDCRNRGYGLKLLQHAVRELVERGVPSVIVYCYMDGDSLGWYRSVGGKSIRRETQYVGKKPLAVECLGWDTTELLAILDRKLERY